MALKIKTPTTFFGKCTTLKLIQEYFGKPSTTQEDISIAVMTAMPNWSEPEQVAQFDEYIYVISGELYVYTENEQYIIKAGEAIKISKNEWVQYLTGHNPANYIAICLPAFQEHLVKRDA